ncbi:hypothetical protein Lal_00024276 [Lupinus albus]|nr:hypothetical protein Lal_00024276 [Lupinus albus]
MDHSSTSDNNSLGPFKSHSMLNGPIQVEPLDLSVGAAPLDNSLPYGSTLPMPSDLTLFPSNAVSSKATHSTLIPFRFIDLEDKVIRGEIGNVGNPDEEAHTMRPNRVKRQIRVAKNPYPWVKFAQARDSHPSHLPQLCFCFVKEALSFSLNSPLAERTENHQALATGTSYNPHTSEHSEWLTKMDTIVNKMVGQDESCVTRQVKSTEQVSIGQNQVPNTSIVGESNSVPMNVDAPPIQDETHCSSSTDVEEARPKQISSIWNHFEQHRVEIKWKVACNYCGKRLFGDPSQGIKHTLLKTTKKGIESVLVGIYAFNQDIARRALVKMIIFHDTLCSWLITTYLRSFVVHCNIFLKGQSQTLNLIDVGADGVNVDWMAKYQNFVFEQNFATTHTIEDGVLPDQGGDFDILAWWKVNEIKYPTLQRNARDLLAIPISTVTSEYSFSTECRILTPHRSRLRPNTVEALMCLQDWLRGDMKGSSNSKLDIIGCGTILEDFDDPTSQ